jgi:hypothetical protein
MRVVTVSPQEKFLFDLLMKVREEGLILQTTDGQQFVLLSMDGWQGFYVGEDEDFATEVEATVKNKELMTFLAARRSKKKSIPLDDVKKQLGLR